jgi:hypothetical protein
MLDKQLTETKPSKTSRAKRIRNALDLRKTITAALEKGGQSATSAKVFKAHWPREMRNRFYDGMTTKKARQKRAVKPRSRQS